MLSRAGSPAFALLLAGAGLLAIASCSSGSGTPSGGGMICGQAISKIRACGFTNTANELGSDCEEPQDNEERCQADCFLNLQCPQIVDVYCREQYSSLLSCFAACEPPPFVCADGTSVDADDRCDGLEQCADASDEAGCPKFTCADGAEIPADWKCDGGPDCADGSDEVGCPGAPAPFDCGNGQFVPASYRCDGFEDCSNGSDEGGCPPEPTTDPVEVDCAALGVPRGS